MGGSDIYAAPAILDAQRPMRPIAAFTLGALRLPSLCLQWPAVQLCGEERCAGSFWTNGVRGDAFENGLLVSYAAKLRQALSKNEAARRVIAA